MKLPLSKIALALAAACALGANSFAEERGGEHGRGLSAHLDARYGHNHYYPERGAVFGALPAGALSVPYRGGNYFFHGGVWFRPEGGRFIVIAPPFGLFLPILPAAYVTLWIGGLAYYYADGVYYTQAPGGYTVVAPPPGADAAQPMAPPPQAGQPAPPATMSATVPPAPVVYPRNGQSPAQTETDQQQCNSWATTQPAAVADASVFQRAVAACLDARGYTVR